MRPAIHVTTMFDRQTTALIRPAVDALARVFVRAGIGANALTFTGLVVGWFAATAIADRKSVV